MCLLSDVANCIKGIELHCLETVTQFEAEGRRDVLQYRDVTINGLEKIEVLIISGGEAPLASKGMEESMRQFESSLELSPLGVINRGATCRHL